MIHIISGKPRGGKTLYAVRLIISELAFGTRPIVTNVPLNLGALAEYMVKTYPGRCVDVFSRVRILTDEETKFFFCYRPGCTIARLSKDEWAKGKVPDYSGITDHGVCWVIDEIQNFYGSRQWDQDNKGRDAMFFLSQHGHLSDTIIGITQAPKNIDTAFRRIAQDFTVVRNLSKERLGFFKLPAVFVRRTFFSEPGDSRQPASETKTFTLDVNGIAACYSTAAGVGMHDLMDADKTEKTKGVPWWVGVAGAVVVLFIIMSMAPAVLAKLFNPQIKTQVVRASESKAPQQNATPAVSKPTPVVVQQIPEKVEQTTPTGTATFDGKTFITMSDGSIRVVTRFGVQPYAAPVKKNIH